MDQLTKKVFRQLYWPNEDTVDFGFRPTYWDIAKSLNESPKSTKGRLDQLLRTAVKRVRIFPDPSLFGLRRTGFAVLLDGEMRRVAEEKTKLLYFVESVHLTHPYFTQQGALKPDKTMLEPCAAMVDIVHLPEENLDRKLELLRAVWGDFTTVMSTGYGTRSYPPQLLKMAGFLRELIRDPFASMKDLAKKMSIGERTAAHRYELLARAGAFSFEPVLDASELGQFVFQIGIPVEPGKRGQVISRFKHEFPENWLGFNKAESLVGVVCTAENLREVDSISERLGKLSDFGGYGLAVGLLTLDNQPNLRFVQG